MDAKQGLRGHCRVVFSSLTASALTSWSPPLSKGLPPPHWLIYPDGARGALTGPGSFSPAPILGALPWLLAQDVPGLHGALLLLPWKQPFIQTALIPSMEEWDLGKLIFDC